MSDAALQSPVEVSRYRNLPAAWSALLMLFTVGAIFLALNQLLNLGFFVGKTLLDTSYLRGL